MSLTKLPVIVLLFVCSICGVCNGASEESTGEFYLGTEKVTRHQAVQMCEERSMKLVSIKTPEKNLAISPFLQKNEVDYPVWVSGQKNPDGTWTWLDGKKIEYFYWGPGEPNAARKNETCMEVYQKYTLVFWNDQPCDDKRAFICEKITECDTELVSVSVGDEECSISTEAPINPKKRFYLSSQKATRAQALKHCSDMFMQLARLHNEEENNALYEVMREKETSSRYWTAGNRRAGHHWEWLNDEPITYFNWAKGEPNSAENIGICLEVYISDRGLVWNDQFCSDERLFVCEELEPVVNITIKGKINMPHGTNAGEKKCSAVVNMV